MTHSFWQEQDQGPPLSCDIAVVGGGIIGTSTAYWLKKMSPASSVVLLEANSIGNGASGRNAGFLLQGTASSYAVDVQTYGADTAKSLWAFTQENRSLVADHFSDSSIQLTPSGSVIAAGSEHELDALVQSAEWLRQHRVDASLWNVQQLEKKAAAHGFHGALFVPSGASMNPLKLLREISGLSGARILEHHPVTGTAYDGQSCTLFTPSRHIVATQVFFALNAYLPLLLPESAPLIQPKRAQMLASTPHAHWLPFPIYSHEGYYYIRQAPDGSLLLGGARHLFKDEEVGYEDRITPGLQDALEAYYSSHFPRASSLSIAKRWSGTMAFTSDGLPLYSEANTIPGSYWASGFNGHGMGYGFRFGKLMANVLLRKDPDSPYQSLFHLSRITKK